MNKCIYFIMILGMIASNSMASAAGWGEVTLSIDAPSSVNHGDTLTYTINATAESDDSGTHTIFLAVFNEQYYSYQYYNTTALYQPFTRSESFTIVNVQGAYEGDEINILPYASLWHGEVTESTLAYGTHLDDDEIEAGIPILNVPEP